MCAWPVWSVWWGVPLVGMLICLAFFFLMCRSGSAGHGCMGMGGHRSTKNESR